MSKVVNAGAETPQPSNTSHSKLDRQAKAFKSTKSQQSSGATLIEVKKPNGDILIRRTSHSSVVAIQHD